MPAGEEINRGQMAKWTAFGETLADVRRERAHQAEIGEKQPGAALAWRAD